MKYYYALLYIFFFSSVYGQGEHVYTNELVHESSPYLKQHAHNPVNWYPWGDEALEKAKKEGKLLLISVGYAACHWCHVMEHESFEDTVVAEIMNKHFVCIKVDREERPDVDQLYMSAAQLINGSGGWPLNAFALADGRPFYAGTYFEKDAWMSLLNFIIATKRKSPEVLEKNAENLTKGIQDLNQLNPAEKEHDFTIGDAIVAFDSLSLTLDHKAGGKKGKPKFPLPVVWDYLLHYGNEVHDDKALKVTHTTLTEIASGGIYDHLGGGFARYSTDADWFAPHFEKMLYDNGQLVELYAQAWQQTGNELYKRRVYETLDFVERELTDSKGGFYSSLDADSEGEEGKYYVWESNELDEILGEDATHFKRVYGCDITGNWEEGKNILFLEPGVSDEGLEDAKSKLLAVRDKRIKPALDDKIILSWNALMLKGYVKAYRAFDDERFLKVAKRNVQFLLKNGVTKSGELMRDCKGKNSKINGFLDDYALMISALIELYQATLDENWLQQAKSLTDYVLAHFSDDTSGMFFYTNNDQKQLVSRKVELHDNVIPSSNAEMAMNLFVLGHYFSNQPYINRASGMVNTMKGRMLRNIGFYAKWAKVHLMMAQGPYEVAIAGKNALQLRKEFDKKYLPNVLFLGGKKGTLELLEGKMVKGETTIYVCKDKVCQMPVTEVSKALEQMQ